MSIATAIQNAQAKVAAAYTACNAKGATMPQTQDLANLPSTIGSISGGSTGEVEEKDVNFYDYDGTRLYSFTAQEALALEELPQQPVHEGLTGQGWNWTLAGIKAEVQEMGFVEIGAHYCTDDNKTRMYLNFPSEDALTFEIPFYEGTVGVVNTIDWGDGTITTHVSTSNNNGVSEKHTYATPGKYVVKLSLVKKYIGTSTSGITFDKYKQFIEKIEFADGWSCGYGKLQRLWCLKSIVTPNTCGFSGVAQNNTSLDCFVEPMNQDSTAYSPVKSGGRLIRSENRKPDYVNNHHKVLFRSTVTGTMTMYYGAGYSDLIVDLSRTSVTSMSGSFGACYSVVEFKFPPTLTSLGGFATVGNDWPLPKIEFPATLTEIIQANNFSRLKNVEAWIFNSTTPPTLAANCFNTNINPIYVPYSADHSIMNAYQNATNWNVYRDRIQEKSIPGYQLLKYVSTDSTAWLNTGIAGDPDLEIYIEFMYGKYVQNGSLYGNYIDDSYTANRVFLGTNQNNYYIGDGSLLGKLCNGGGINTLKYGRVSSGTVIIGGVTTALTSDGKTANTTLIALGNRNTTDPITRDIGLRIYRFIIRKNGVKLIDLVPVLNSNNVAGFYDYVSDSFKGSSSGVDFTAGPLVDI